MRLHRCVCIAIGFLLSASVFGSQSQVKFGSYSYNVPAGWTSSQDGKVLTLKSDDGLMKGARIEVFLDEALSGSFDNWYDRKWETLRAGRTAQQMSDRSKQENGPATGIVRSAIYSQNQLELVVAFSINSRAILARAKLTSAEQVAPLQDVLINVLDPALTKAGGGPPPDDKKGPPQKTDPPPTDPALNGGTTQPAGPSKTQNVDIEGLKVNPNAVAPTGSPERVAHMLAEMYLTNPQGGFDALTLAVRKSGFSIWSADKKPVAQPLTTIHAGVAFNENDLALYYAMSRGGVIVQFGKFSDAFQMAGTKLSPSWYWTANFADMMRAGLASSDPGRHFYALFLSEVFKQSSGVSILRQEQWGQAHVDPALMLLIFHPFAECVRSDMTRLVRAIRSMQKGKPPVANDLEQFWASIHPNTFLAAQFDPAAPAPGWVEDGAVGTMTSLNGFLADKAVNAFVDAATNQSNKLSFGKVLNPAETAQMQELFKNLEKLKTMNKFLGDIGPFVNFIASIAKFITTYAALDATFEVLPEKEPLVRTKSRSPGEERDVKVTLTENPSKVQQVMKSIRPFLAPFGIDLDQPQSGPLSGAEVTWQMLGDAQYKSIWFKGQNIRRSTTDSNGSATVTVEGRPQDADLTKYKLQPFIRRESIGVTIAIKAAEIKQDLVDAVFGGVGILALGAGEAADPKLVSFGGAKKGVTGGGAILGPIMEMLYRTDWAYKGFKLNVQDWRGEVMLLDLGLKVTGKGVVNSYGMIKRVTVDHSVDLFDSNTQESVMLYPTGQMMAASDPNRTLGGKSATTNLYATKNNARYGYEIHDRWDWKGKKIVGDCLNYKEYPVDDWATWTAPARAGGGYQSIMGGVTAKTAQNDTGMKAWIDTYHFSPYVFQEFSRSPSRLTSENFYQGPTIAAWMRNLPLDISTADKRTYPGSGNEPTFMVLESSGVENNVDGWFGSVPVKAVATWKVTRIIASDPTMEAVLHGLCLSRSLIRQACGETRATMAARVEASKTPISEYDMAATCTPTAATVVRANPGKSARRAK